MMKLKIIAVDQDGFQGRDFHPQQADVGKVVTVISMHTEASYQTYESSDFAGIDVAQLLHEIAEHPSYQVFNCITTEGRKLTLVEFEVEIAK